MTSSALIVRGRLKCASGVLNVVADKLIPLKIATKPSSREFR
jgi:error-prone DNA polymerase